MNKAKLLFSTFLLTALCLVACRQTPKTEADGCAIAGHTSFAEFTSAVLMYSNSHAVIDSVAIDSGKFAFGRTARVDQPYMAIVRLINPDDSLDVMDMPVAVENGDVYLTLDEYINSEGTPLNRRVKKFLDGMQAVHDALARDSNATADDVRQTFSSFYKEQINTNADNCLGRYIYKNYGLHLSEKDKRSLKLEEEN